jgi:hypothetical protein
MRKSPASSGCTSPCRPRAPTPRARRTTSSSSDIGVSSTTWPLIAAADGLQIQWLLDPTQDMGERLAQLWAALQRVR